MDSYLSIIFRKGRKMYLIKNIILTVFFVCFSLSVSYAQEPQWKQTPLPDGNGIHHSIKPDRYTICVANQYKNGTTYFLFSHTDWNNKVTSTETFTVSPEGKLIKSNGYSKNIETLKEVENRNEAYKKCAPHLASFPIRRIPRLAAY